MPHVIVKLWPGKSEQHKTRLAEKITKDVMDVLNYGDEAISVAFEEIRPGDVVWFPPGLKHWHGASPTTAMTHIAIQEALDGKVVEWMEKVSDQQYRK